MTFYDLYRKHTNLTLRRAHFISYNNIQVIYNVLPYQLAFTRPHVSDISTCVYDFLFAYRCFSRGFAKRYTYMIQFIGKSIYGVTFGNRTRVMPLSRNVYTIVLWFYCLLCICVANFCSVYTAAIQYTYIVAVICDIPVMSY